MKKRTKIIVGSKKIGDKVEAWDAKGTILSFGQSWAVKEAGQEHFKGQIWDECENRGCNNEPSYAPSHTCEKCINRRWGNIDREYCYAYLD